MSSEPTMTQTDYTEAGKEISDAAADYYLTTQDQLADYTANIQNSLDPYLEYGDLYTMSDTNDFLSEYMSKMSDMTSTNYAATSGGFSSVNQGNYDSLQDYYNELATDLYSNNLSFASDLAQNEYNVLTGALGSFGTGYGYGEDYSDIEQYNYIADQTGADWVDYLGAGLSVGAAATGNAWAVPIISGVTSANNTSASDYSSAIFGQSLEDLYTNASSSNSSSSSNNSSSIWSSLFDSTSSTGGYA